MSRTEINEWVRHRSKEDTRLYELYGEPLEKDHYGQYVAISADRGTILGEDPDRVLGQAIRTSGSGKFALTRVGNKAFGQWGSARRIVSDRYPYLSIRVNVRQWEIESYALIDTGFTGSLAVPSEFLNQTTVMPDSRVGWALADGSIVDAPIYLGDVEIVGFTAIPGISITFWAKSSFWVVEYSTASELPWTTADE